MKFLRLKNIFVALGAVLNISSAQYAPDYDWSRIGDDWAINSPDDYSKFEREPLMVFKEETID